MRFVKVLLIMAFGSICACAALFAQGVDLRSWRILVPKSTSSLPLLALGRGRAEIERDMQIEIPEGLRFEVDFFANHPQALALLLRGEVDMILTGTSQGWENHLGGGPIVMVNTGIWGVSSLVGRIPSFSGIEDLRGKRIALPFPGSPLDFQMRAILVTAGLDPDRDVELIYAPPVQTAGRLLKGQLDAAPLPEPLASNLVLRKGLQRLMEIKDAWAEISGGDPLSPQVSLFMIRSAEGKRAGSRATPAAVQTVVGLWRQSSRWITEHPQEAGGIFAPLLDLPPDVLQEAVENTVYAIPEFAENQRRVMDYFGRVNRYYSELGRGESLAPEFFFSP